MELQELVTFNQIISGMSGEEKVLKLLFWEQEQKNDLSAYSSQLMQSSTIHLLLGPEGGFTEKEVEEARGMGWQTVGLGERILRAETAAVAAVSIVQHLRGCM